MTNNRDITFLKAFLTNKGLPPIFKSISFNKNVLYTNQDSSGTGFTHNLMIIKDTPEYLKITPLNNLGDIKFNTIRTLKGHFIDCQLFADFEAYFSKHISPKTRSNLNRYKNRLETCFNIKYVAYYGHIKRIEYDRLFTFLEDFLIRRFQEKKEVNYELQHLQEFHDLCFDMIMNKSASLFVIYNNNTPISIRINMFKNDLAYYIISGYDIDYGKFHLGSVDMLKNIEWCFNNDYKIYDLLKGYDYYKKKWATTPYFNTIQIIYNARKPYHTFKASVIGFKEKLKQNVVKKMKSLNLNRPHSNLKKVVYRLTNRSSDIQEFEILIKNDIVIEERAQKINFHGNKSFNGLKKHIYNFLFINKERLDDVSVYRRHDSPNHYEIRGKLKNQLVIIKQ